MKNFFRKQAVLIVLTFAGKESQRPFPVDSRAADLNPVVFMLFSRIRIGNLSQIEILGPWMKSLIAS